MRYWGYFAGKLVAGAGIMYALLSLLDWSIPPGPCFYQYCFPRFPYNLPYTLLAGAWFLLSCGTLYMIILDQRYRCRVCLRRLRMPVETGSWGKMLLLGRPKIEYICPYGHGTLKADELQISGLANPEWTPNSDDIWDELQAASKKAGDRE